MNAPVVKVRPWGGFALVATAYAAATVAGALVLRAVPDWHPRWALAAADAVATVVVFCFSVGVNNSSVYDPYWSLAPIPLALFLAFGPGGGALEPRHLAILLLVTAYGLRLTWNWIRGWTGLAHEDWRYVGFRQQTGKGYWPFSFAALHFFPTVMVFLGILPLHGAFTGSAPFGWLDVVACLVTAGAIAVEGIADNQLRAYRQSHPEGGICDVGLWAWSRHPNYFGEISFWLGLLLFGLAAGAPAWTSVGFVAMVALFVGASIPMAEKRSLARRPRYAEHQQRVSMLLPWPPKR